MYMLMLPDHTGSIDAYTHASGPYEQRTLTPSHMVERVLDDYGFGHWKRASGEMKTQNPNPKTGFG